MEDKVDDFTNSHFNRQLSHDVSIYLKLLESNAQHSDYS